LFVHARDLFVEASHAPLLALLSPQQSDSVVIEPGASLVHARLRTWALIGSVVIALVLVVLVQGKWTRVDSWFAAVFASAVMAMVIEHYVNQIN
jgi:hypothetical protein